MEDLSLHVLDVVENSVRAGARNVEIRVEEDDARDLILLEITDDGAGMDEQMCRKAVDPFVTGRKEKGIGLGLSLLAQAAETSGGGLELESAPGRGTRLRATFRKSHIDRQPLGDLDETLLTLAAGTPQVDFRFIHVKEGREHVLDTREVRARLEGSPMSSPRGLGLLRESLRR